MSHLNLDKFSVHYVRVSGYSKDPRVIYYYGVWKVTMRRTTSPASAALSFLKDNLNIPHMENQMFTVMDIDGNPIDDIEPCYAYDAEESSIVRSCIEEPLKHDFIEV